jgi:signal transduction histidine kinase
MTPETEHSHERILLVAHKHWIGFVPDIVIVAVPVTILAIFWSISATLSPVLHALFALLIPLGALIIWAMLAMLWTNYFLDILIVTDQRLVYVRQESLVRRSVMEWGIHNVQRVGVHMSNALESFFNYGSLEMRVQGEDDAVVLDRLPDPEYISAIILKQDDRYGQLKETARKEHELLHFISHEVKGHLTRSKAAFAGIVQGDYGPVSPPLDTMAHQALADTQKGVETVMSVLDGTAPVKKRFDLSETVRRSVAGFRSEAAHKHLALIPLVGDSCMIVGDERTLEEHVLRNLLDNAVRYTAAGSIQVSLRHEAGSARLTVSDTGSGITTSDMEKLFTEGGHGARSKEMNPESTGYGLFIAKQIVEAHGGKMSAYSDGMGQGTTFTVELPLG